MDIMQMSLSGAVLIIAVVIVRGITLHRVPKNTFLILWYFVLCRLLIPFSIPSRFSIYTGLDRLKHVFTDKEVFTTSVVTPGIPKISTVSDTVRTMETIPQAADISPYLVIWLTGMCISALFFIIIYFRCRREFHTSLPVKNEFTDRWLTEHPMERKVQIRQSDRIKAPLTYGVFRTVVLLPKETDWSDEAKLGYIFTHEYVHIRHFDALTKLLLASVLCVHWFNPAVWLMYILANRDIELTCDERVVRTYGDTMKSTYALMLLSMEEKKNRITALYNNFSKNATKERIVSIMKLKKTSLYRIILALALVTVLVSVFSTSSDVIASTGKAESTGEEFLITYKGNTFGLGSEYLDFLETPKTAVRSSESVLSEGDYYQNDTFDDLLVQYYVSSGNREVFCIDIYSAAVITYRGISIGSTKAEVLAAYKEISDEVAGERVKTVWYDKDSNDPLSDRIYFYFDDNDLVEEIILERQSITNSDWAAYAYPEFTEEYVDELADGHHTGVFLAENVCREFLDTLTPYENLRLVTDTATQKLYRASASLSGKNYTGIEVKLKQFDISTAIDDLKVWGVVFIPLSIR